MPCGFGECARGSTQEVHERPGLGRVYRGLQEAPQGVRKVYERCFVGEEGCAARWGMQDCEGVCKGAREAQQGSGRVCRGI